MEVFAIIHGYLPLFICCCVLKFSRSDRRMFGQTMLGRANLSDSANRIFAIEVEGLRQSDASDRLSYSIRNSGTTLIRVPYSRLNEEMQRINRLGGKIVGVKAAS